MKRILQIIDSMDRGGAQVFIMNIYRNIDRNKVQFDFLVSCKRRCAFDDEIEELGGIIYHVPSRRQGILKNRRALLKFFSENKYDCVHYHTSCPSYLEPLIIAKKLGVKTRIIHSHSSNGAHGIYHSIMRSIHRPQINKLATKYYSCSRIAADWMYGKYVNYEQIDIIPNAIQLDKFLYNKQKRDIKRKKLGIGEDEILIGHVGRFSKVKNHEFIIDVFKSLTLKSKKYKLLLVGDGELIEEINNKIKELKLSEKVIVLTGRDDVNDLMQAMDLFIMPSLYEGFPVTLVEAQASGLPCIISDTISQEIILSDLIKKISLENTPDYWSNEILKSKSFTSRIKYNEIINTRGFSAIKLSNKLEKVYLSE